MTTNFKLYQVGGSVRDSFIGKKTDDIDYSVLYRGPGNDINQVFNLFVKEITELGYTVFKEYPDVFTVKAKFPKGHKHENLVADFVIARNELGYDALSRKPTVVAGSLFDDLRRRDFTVNCIAYDEENDLFIDPFDGRYAIQDEILQTPIDPLTSFLDDPLRVIRLFRFHVVLGFEMEKYTLEAALNPRVWDKMELVVSKERVQVEFAKMFNHNVIESLNVINLLDSEQKDVIFNKMGIKFKVGL